MRHGNGTGVFRQDVLPASKISWYYFIRDMLVFGDPGCSVSLFFHMSKEPKKLWRHLLTDLQMPPDELKISMMISPLRRSDKDSEKVDPGLRDTMPISGISELCRSSWSSSRATFGLRRIVVLSIHSLPKVRTVNALLLLGEILLLGDMRRNKSLSSISISSLHF